MKPTHSKVHTNRDPSWWEKPRHIRGLMVGLTVVCVALVLADLFYDNPHPHFPQEKQFAFQAWFGFVSFVVIVFLGRFLRLFISRAENFYDSEETNESSH